MSQRQYFVICGSLTVLAMMVMVGIQRSGLSGILNTELSSAGTSANKHPKNRWRGPIHEKQGVHEPCSNQSCVWEKKQTSRKHLLWDMCRAFHAEADTYYPPLFYEITKGSAHKPKRAPQLQNLFVIDSLKLIYCSIPKVSCTSWKRLFLVLAGNFSSMADIGQGESHVLMSDAFRNLASYPLKEAQKLLATYRKFVFVRNPFERVLSAYQDKFQNDYPASNAFRNAWSEKIIRSTTSSPKIIKTLLKTQRRKDGTLNVTFPQFVRYLLAIEGPETRRYMNEHWTQMYGLCHPCLIDYDWIGHYDSLKTDADSILSAVGADPNIKFPNFSTNPTGSSNGETLLRYYSTLTASEIEALYRHFTIDFSLFGFDIPRSVRGLLNYRMPVLTNSQSIQQII